jgi:hypothetical protein
MKKAELLARVEALEARIRVLETRPWGYWPGYYTTWPLNTSPTVVHPYTISSSYEAFSLADGYTSGVTNSDLRS